MSCTNPLELNKVLKLKTLSIAVLITITFGCTGLQSSANSWPKSSNVTGSEKAKFEFGVGLAIEILMSELAVPVMANQTAN